MTSSRPTDWNRYYEHSVVTSRFSRPITTKRLLVAFQRYVKPGSVIVELGGANSCVYGQVVELIRPAAYHVVDTNRFGLDLLAQRAPATKGFLHCESVLDLKVQMQADVVFSLGLIEHFDPAGTRQAIQSHFQLAKPGGVVIITFPTPTWLYRATRGVAELAGKWAFHDERALQPEEVIAVVQQLGDILHQELIWPIFLTQTLMVIRRR